MAQEDGAQYLQATGATGPLSLATLTELTYVPPVLASSTAKSLEYSMGRC